MSGSKPIDLALAILNFIAILVAISSHVFTIYIDKRPDTDDMTEYLRLKQQFVERSTVKILELDALVLNLFDRKLSFLNVTASILPLKAKYYAKLEKNKEVIYDTMIRIAGQTSPEDINSLTGKILFEHAIKEELEKEFKKNMIKNIYFTNFVVQ